ncbi:MAG: response regulator [Anaerolineae bacterium]
MTFQELVSELRAALEHLYDPHYLRRCRLAVVFGISQRHDAPSALERILREALAALEPGADEPPDSRAWDVYEALSYRYLRGETREAVADHLGVSSRQLRRFLRAGLEQVAQQLWEQYHLAAAAAEAPDDPLAPDPSANNSPLGRELAWLSDAATSQATALHQVLPAVLAVVEPMARQHAVSLVTAVAGELPDVAVHPVAVRQAMLTLLAAAIPDAAGGQVSLSARVERQAVVISIRSKAGRVPGGRSSGVAAESVQVAQRIAEMCGGRLTLSPAPGAFAATLSLPAVGQVPVLVIDDNVDTLRLLQRYALGTPFGLITTRDPEQALTLAEAHAPSIVVLDVMMPQVDGWEVLARLRQHPRTSQIPVIICSVLPQGGLAQSLGASAYLQKPVTRQAFVNALSQLIASAG